MEPMNRILSIDSIVLVLFVSLLANALASAFHGEVFMHELGHNHQYSLSTAEAAHAEYSLHEYSDEENSDLTVHICFNTAYHPIIFTELPLVLSVTDEEALFESISFQIPKSIPDSPFRPPRSIFPS